MRRLAAWMAAFVTISNSAWAFERSTEAVGLMYFSIPFGAAKEREPAPRFGFRLTYGEGPSVPDREASATYRDLDLRLHLDGRTDLLVNGVEVSQQSSSWHAAADAEPSERSVWTAVGIAALVGVVALVAVGGKFVIGGGGGGDSNNKGVVVRKD